MACPTPNKVKFTSERKARRSLRIHRVPGGPVRAYPCGNHWHLTGVEEREK